MPEQPAPLRLALDDLAAVARRLGVDAHDARREGVALAATVASAAQPMYRAAQDWARATGMADPDNLKAANEAFVESASSGRKWRGSPTTLVAHLRATGTGAAEYADALADVVEAAATLGGGNAAVAENVVQTAQAQRLGATQVLTSSGLGVTPGSLTFDPLLSPLQDPRIQESLRLIGALGNPLSPAPTAENPLSPTQPGDPHTGAVATADPAPAAPAEPEQPAEPEKSVEELLAELDAMIGLDRVKREVHQQVAMLKVEQKRVAAGMRNPDVTRHLVFVGNPGTGKTTVARMVSGIYHALGLLEKGHLVEVDRSELVAGYLGQTAMKTADVCDKATGGVLFIDEAYALGGDDYGKESINTLVKEMEDGRDKLVVIVAGYTHPMVVFMAQNPGLSSRFKTVIEFDDYTDDELVQILRKLASAADYDISREAEMTFRGILAGAARTQAFGNGRFARNLLEEAIGRHAWRLQDVEDPSHEQLRELKAEDFRQLADPEPVGDTPDPEGDREPEGTAQTSEGDPAAPPGSADDPDERDDRAGVKR
jgi:hypothetical protein